MAETKELRKIKKLYGEKFMHLCRELFPTLLEQEGMLTRILTTYFANNARTLFEDLNENGLEEEFKNFIFSKVDVEKEKLEIIEEKTPYELLDEAGYDLYECISEEEIQNFRKYYKPGEELCTFRGNRLERCVVFWAVKKDVDKIKREDFTTPRRDDEYGTSVMSIQFTRDKNSTVSIKNRYNHTVNNPDATYGNDLDKIIPGLTGSFAKLLKEDKGIDLKNDNIEELDIPGYVVANDGRYYKYNFEINGIYYCPGNVIVADGNVIQLEPEKRELINYFILDKENKTIELYDKTIRDSFTDAFEHTEQTETITDAGNETKEISTRVKGIERLEIARDTEKGTRKISIRMIGYDEPIIIEIEKDNNIVGYTNGHIEEVGDSFLSTRRPMQLERKEPDLKYLSLPRLKKAGNYFLGGWGEEPRSLAYLELPEQQELEPDFLKQITEDTIFNNAMKKAEQRKKYESAMKQIDEAEKKARERNKKSLLQPITPKDIAKLDQQNKITNTEISWGKRVINTIRNIFKKKDSTQR